MANKLIINFSKELNIGHKGDKHRLKSRSKLSKSINNSKRKSGDIYDKATELLISLVKNHCFESANRRTAVFITDIFLKANNEKSKIEFMQPENAKVMIAIRENRLYSFNEIKNWLKTGKIGKYER